MLLSHVVGLAIDIKCIPNHQVYKCESYVKNSACLKEGDASPVCKCIPGYYPDDSLLNCTLRKY